MKVEELLAKLEVKLLTANVSALMLQTKICGGFASDLLSNVMGQAQPGQVWITMQGHQNVAAVASLIGLAAVIVAGSAPVAADTLQKAEQNGVVIFSSPLSAFEISGRLYALLNNKA